MQPSAHFEEIDRHLLTDESPSVYCNQISEEAFFQKPPFDLLCRMKQTEQSPQHHPEGNVWNHTMLVVDQAARRRQESKNPRALMWAALLHDIGKPPATRKKKGKITSYGHDKIGAELAQRFLEAFVDDEGLIREVAALVRWHMQLLFVVKDLPFADISVMKAQTDLNELALLGLCDRLGRGSTDEKTEKENCRLFLRKCAAYKEENRNGF